VKLQCIRGSRALGTADATFGSFILSVWYTGFMGVGMFTACHSAFSFMCQFLYLLPLQWSCL
jgi:hypothetical protein